MNDKQLHRFIYSLMGADRTINHRNAIDEELKAIDIPQVDFILCLNSTAQHWSALANAIAPKGRLCSIVKTRIALLSCLAITAFYRLALREIYAL